MSNNSELLFPHLSVDALDRLAGYDALLAKTHPLPGRHRASLPSGVGRLSRTLTSERLPGEVAKYMQSAEGFAAYVYAFLPWNLLRQARLLAGLDMNLESGAVVADLGSGPLTAVQALWLARPELRERELTVFAVDRVAKALKVGRDLFKQLAGPDCPWRVEILTRGLTTRLPRRANLLLAANVLNENSSGRGLGQRIVPSLLANLVDGGRLLLVEPGTRTGGRLITAAREEFLEEGMAPLAPCPHDRGCPMPGIGGRPWCHFRFEAHGAPHWLTRLSTAARLPKSSLSLSFVYMENTGWSPDYDPEYDQEDEDRPLRIGPRDAVRVISAPFAVPSLGADAHARYGCSVRGLTVLHGGRASMERLETGQLITPDWPAHPKRDEKSGGVLVEVSVPRPEPKSQESRTPKDRPQGPAHGKRLPSQRPAKASAKAPGKAPGKRSPPKKRPAKPGKKA